MIGRIIVSRILRAFVLLVIVVLFLSYVFGTLAEERLSSQVFEEIGVELRSNPSYPLLSNEEKLEFKTNLINLKRTQYGLDKPFFTRVMQNALNVITLHFGDALVLKSRSGSKSVSAIILEALPRTVILFTTGSLIGILIGLFLGLKAAQKSGTILIGLSRDLRYFREAYPCGGSECFL
jgi:ABC-type dipeptide/oligopeptide/nickel transport systems, permease components